MGLAEELGWIVYAVGSQSQFWSREKKGQSYMGSKMKKTDKRPEDPYKTYPDENVRT